MRRFLLALSFAGTLATGTTGAIAQQTHDPAVEATIQHQFDAFIAGDVTTAFSYAAPNIQGIFGTPENFGLMVQQGYPMVWHPSSVKYLNLRQGPGGTFQKVAITDQAGALHVLEYQMIQGEGGWVIGGVQILQEPEVGA